MREKIFGPVSFVYDKMNEVVAELMKKFNLHDSGADVNVGCKADGQKCTEPSEQLSIEMTNETSNDSNKENQPESTTTPPEETPTTVALTVENRPVPDSPGKRFLLFL